MTESREPAVSALSRFALPNLLHRRGIWTLWLGFLTLCVLINHVAISRLAQSAAVRDQRSTIASLQEQVDSFGQQLAALHQQPVAVSQPALASALASVNDRFAGIERTLSTLTPQEGADALRSQLHALEIRLASAERKASRTLTPPAPIPAPSEPPFTVLGTEMRGGQAFLAIAPAGVRTLAQVRLLRPGDSQDNWQLDSLGPNVAEFHVDGHPQRITLP